MAQVPKYNRTGISVKRKEGKFYRRWNDAADVGDPVKLTHGRCGRQREGLAVGEG